MNVPISWLEEYVKVKMDLDVLMWEMTVAGMTTEAYEKRGKEVVLNVEVTPNRPDWLSILGIAREIGAIQKSSVRPPKAFKITNKEADLPIKVDINHKLSPRYTAITMKGVEVKDSPDWMKKYLKLIGLRPINNLVDITNFVMFELGVPLHVFDYDKIKGRKMRMQLSKGGEKFVSVDGIEYDLPENAIIIKDQDRVIDLCGIKGGDNTAIDKNTDNIYIHVPIYTPELIRKTSQKMKLASEASYIYERGAHSGGTKRTLSRAVDLVLRHAGGGVASDVIDIKKKQFVPNRLVLSKKKLDSVLGIELDNRKVVKLLRRLDLRPESRGSTIVCTIPTYRQDITIEEDLIEEVARMYGYNNFPRTLPNANFRKEDVFLRYDNGFEHRLKSTMTGGGYNEVRSLSLISKDTIESTLLPLDTHIKLANPVSKEYEYLRISLMPGLLNAIKINKNHKNVKLFEFGKVFQGPVDTREESYKLSAATNIQDLRKAKGIVDLLLDELNIDNVKIKRSSVEKSIWHPNNSAVLEKNNSIIGTYGYINPKVLYNFDIKQDIFGFEFDVDTLKRLMQKTSFEAVSKYPYHIEDITLEPGEGTDLADVIAVIKDASSIIRSVQLKEVYKKKYTLRIKYLHKGKTLNDKDIEKIRNKFTKRLQKMKVELDL